MFRILEDPSSGSLVQCLDKNCKYGSIVSADMDVTGVMAAYSGPLCVCECVDYCAFPYSELHTHTHTHSGHSMLP